MSGPAVCGLCKGVAPEGEGPACPRCDGRLTEVVVCGRCECLDLCPCCGAENCGGHDEPPF